MNTLWQDVRYGVRSLTKSPGFAFIAILTLALGIGANSTIFSWINSTVLNPIPGVAHTSEFVELSATVNGRDAPISYPDFIDLRDRNRSLSSMIGFSMWSMSLTGNVKPERVWGVFSSANYFDALGIRPILGRGFLPSEGSTPGSAPVVVISYRLWQTHFGGDSGVIGQTIEINKRPYTLIGVTPPIFQGTQTGLRADMWIPQTMAQQFVSGTRNILQDRGSNWVIPLGHLKPGVTPEQAQADLNIQMQQIVRQFPDSHKDINTIAVNPLWRAPFGANYYLRAILFLLMAISGVILLLACANVANLLLVRSVSRRREMAIRLSVGATRWRLVRQLLAESLILSLCGGGIAMLFTIWTAGTLSDFIPPAEIPVAMNVRVDQAVILATLVISILTGVIFGILPALRSSSLQPGAVLKEESGSTTGGVRKARLSSVLVVAQIAMSLLLLVCAGLFIRSFRLAQNFNPGFNPHHVLVQSYDLGSVGYDHKSGAQFHRRLFDKLQALPGVESATLADWVPLGFASHSTTVKVEGYAPRPHESMDIDVAGVAPKYLQTMQIPLVAGHEFTDADISGSQPVSVVNQAFVDRFWPHQDAIGKQISVGDTSYSVVGVAQNSDTDHLKQTPSPFLYLPLFQDYDPYVSIQARVAGDPLAYVSAVQDAVHQLDAGLPLFDLMTLDSRIQLNTTSDRIGGVFVGAFGFLALLLAAVGIYGVLAYTTRQRTHEIGIRMALGAGPREVFALVLWQGALLALLGVGIGLAASFALTRALSSKLFGITATDPLTFSSVALLLFLVAMVACYIPARRAMQTDPIIALRYE
ncbi:MAG TPA: ABC transporter permease [Candidatus Acidoferrales bacterium]|nr:ABC transporter permease [Candidatus Acidoferrales bacterium]